jgi:hypothetical protein
LFFSATLVAFSEMIGAIRIVALFGFFEFLGGAHASISLICSIAALVIRIFL